MSPFPAGLTSGETWCLPTAALPEQNQRIREVQKAESALAAWQPHCPPLLAVEQIRRMRGGSQPHLMRCSDENLYVVKFPNNPQGTRILANEYLAAKLCEALGLPVPEVRVINVREQLIRLTEEMKISLRDRSVSCEGGLCFGSKYPNPRSAVFDFLPDEYLKAVHNLKSFEGMLVFDLWTSNSDSRQAIFWKDVATQRYQVAMVDNGNCFMGNKWGFKNMGRLALYGQRHVYFGISSIQSFDPWLEKLERVFNFSVLAQIVKEIPPSWYGSNLHGIYRLLERLDRRRIRVRRLLMELLKTCPHMFPNVQKDPSTLFQAKSRVASYEDQEPCEG